MGEPVAAVVAATRELARDAAELVEVEYEPLDVLVDARESLKDGTVLHDDAGSNVGLERRLRLGRLSRRRSPRPTTSSRSTSSTSTASTRRRSSAPARSSSTTAAPGSGRSTATTSCPGVGAIWMAPGAAHRDRQAALRHAGHRRRLRQQDLPAPAARRAAACWRASSNRPVQWTEWRTDHHTSNVARQRALVPRHRGRGQGRRRRCSASTSRRSTTAAPSRATSRSAASSGRRSRPGCTRWRNIRVEFTQVMTNKAPVSPNRGYSRMQHLWLTERIIDIVATELELDPVEIRKRNYVQAEQMPYETPNGCVYDSGDYARALDIALELIGYDSIEERRDRGRGARQAARLRDRLDARLRARTTSASRSSSTRSSSSRATTRSRR